MQKELKVFIETLFTDKDVICFAQPPIKRENRAGKDLFFTRDKLLSFLSDNQNLEKVANFGHIPCIAPNPFKPGMKRAGENVAVVNAIFIDIDNAPLPSWANRAHFVFSRTEKNHHIYFLTKRIENTEENKVKAVYLTKKIIAECGGDKSVHDVGRVLRLPYTRHVKAGITSAGYNAVFFNPSKPRLTLKQIYDAVFTTGTDKPPEPALTSPDNTPDDVQKYIKQSAIKKGTVYAGQGRSRALWFVGLDCHGWGVGLNDAEALGIELNAQICNPPESDEVVRHQVQSAYAYRKAPFGNYKTGLDASKTDAQKSAAFRRHEELQNIRDALAGWVYVAQTELFINTENNFELTSEKQQNNYLAHLCATKFSITDLIREHAVMVLDALDFRPDISERIYTERGLFFYNRYAPPVLQEPSGRDSAAGAVKIFCEHLQYLTTSEAEYQTLLEYFAFIAQNPGKKLAWAPLIVSQRHGVGKSILLYLLQGIFSARYVDAVDAIELTQPHTDYLKDKLLVLVEEVEHGDKNVMSKLKSLISSTVFRVIAKYARTYTASNTCNFIFFSNRIDAIRIDKYDRRLFVVFNNKKEKEENYYTELYKVFTENAQDIYGFLLSVDLSAFSPHRRPTMTEGKKLLIGQSQSELEIYLNEQKENNSGAFAQKIIRPKKVLADIDMLGPRTIQGRVGMKAVKFYLLQNGYRPHTVHLTEDGERIHCVVYFAGTETELKIALKEYENAPNSVFSKR